MFDQKLTIASYLVLLQKYSNKAAYPLGLST
uniref:Uncharacterized protein n=1 Tax=Arundo donax TaxID=35708 RepID=A0A0A8ZVU9_ARUDO